MKWLDQAIRDDNTHQASASRITMLIAAVTLCLSTLLLTVGSFWRIELVPALTAFGSVLGTMAGASYITSKVTGKKNEPA